jgi:hypothetical protein
VRRIVRQLDGAQNVANHVEAKVRSICQSRAKESNEEEDAIYELDDSARHFQLVAEPMNVEERRRQLVQNERRGVVVDKWSLPTASVNVTAPIESSFFVRLTNPAEYTSSDEIACASIPNPNNP